MTDERVGEAKLEAGRRPLRILAVGNMYPPQHAGGYELMWQFAMRHARALGHRVRVLTSDYVGHSGRAEEDPDVYRSLRWYWDLARYEFPSLSLADRVRLERHNACILRRHLEDYRPDVVAWWSMGCMSLSLIEQARRRGFPAVFVVHDDWLVYGFIEDRWLRTWTGPRRGLLAPFAERLFGIPTSVDLARAGPFVFNSQYTRDRARAERRDGLPATVIHPGVMERFLEPLPAHPWRWRFAYIGRIDRMKGIDTAIAALAHLPESATLAIWGSGDARYIAEMQALAAGLDVAGRVSFCGFLSEDGLRGAYEAADAVIFPVRWNEPFGLVPLEAMGVGRPVVTTARGGTAEYVRDRENALIFAADDVMGLVQRLTCLAHDASLRARLIEDGFRTAERFTASAFAERTVAEIERAAGGAGRVVPQVRVTAGGPLGQRR